MRRSRRGAGRTLFVCSIFLAVSPLASFAQEMPPVSVAAPDDYGGHSACQITNSSIVAAVEAGLRYNRVPVASTSDYYEDKALRVRIDAVSIEQSAGFCAVHLSLTLLNSQYVINAVTREVHFADVAFCDKGTLLTGSRTGLQERLNSAAKNFTDECVSEYFSSVQK